jgi:hypothetical protein
MRSSDQKELKEQKRFPLKTKDKAANLTLMTPERQNCSQGSEK